MNLIPFAIIIAIIGLVVWEIFGEEKKLRPWLVDGLAFIIGMTVFGNYFLLSRKVDNKLRVVGYASKNFESDLVKWTLTVQKNTDVNGLMVAYTSMTADMNSFKDLLLAAGITEKDINIQPPTSNPLFAEYGQITGYSVNQTIYILSSDIKKVEGLALNPEFFAKRGLVLQQSSLAYIYSKLPELKKQLLGEATADALARAREITSSAKARLGKIKSARAGVFQITEPYSTDVSDYGFYNTNTRSKSISVTVTTECDM